MAFNPLGGKAVKSGARVGHYYRDTDEHTLVVNPLVNPVPCRGTRACQQSQSGGFYRGLGLKCPRVFTGAEGAGVQSHAASQP